MKRFIVFFVLALAISSFPYSFGQSVAPETSLVTTGQTMEYVPGEVIVKFKPAKINLKTSGGQLRAQNFAIYKDMENSDTIENSNIAVMTIEGNESVEQKIVQLQSDVNVEYAEPNYIYHDLSFNDTYSGNLWGLSQISGYQAFAIFSGNADQNITGTVVAVVDAGVAYDHPDLVHQMRSGVNCKDENGNALGGCIGGYDFADSDKDPYPVRSDHGTHVAGTIAAEANNAKGILGINFNARIMAIRVGDASMTLENVIKGIDFARQNGAKIINASFGGSDYSAGMYDAINAFRSAGGLFIAAAGNNHSNNDGGSHIYPCDYTLDNIICVAATDQSDGLASFSDYGTSSVDVGAPGTSIYSTLATIVTATGMFENFESTSTGAIPNGRSTGGAGNDLRGVSNIGGSWGHVLYGNITHPYNNNVNSTIQKSVSTANASGVTLDFRAMCDTQYSTSSWNDYMALEVSADGSNFSEVDRRDEAYLDNDLIEGNNVNGETSGHLSYDLTGMYISSGFTLRFRRVTDGSDNNYSGCLVDNVKITTYKANTTSEPYGYMQGTSMAVPHVAGLASLARSMRPELSYSDIRSVIIGSGDSLSSLSGKTVSGKRINAYNVLYDLTQAVTGSIVFLSGSRINTTGAHIRLSTSKTGTYQLSGAGMVGVLTGSITLTGSDVYVRLTAGDGVKNVGVIFFDGIGKQSQLYTASIILDTTKPSMPILLSPISGTIISGTVNLLRNISVDTGGMSGYYYEISDDSGMNHLLVTGIVYTTGVNLNLFSGNIYYRRIRSFDIVGRNSDFSQTGNFVLLRDSRPDIFTFTSISNAELSTEYASNQITVSGINTGSQISIAGGTYQVNNSGSFVSTTGTIYSGDTIKVKVISSTSYSTQVIVTLNIGDTTGNFIVTSKSAPSGGGGGGGGGGTIIPTCILSQLVCTGGIYELKSGENCQGGSLSNACAISGSILKKQAGTGLLRLLDGSDLFECLLGNHFYRDENLPNVFGSQSWRTDSHPLWVSRNIFSGRIHEKENGVRIFCAAGAVDRS